MDVRVSCPYVLCHPLTKCSVWVVLFLVLYLLESPLQVIGSGVSPVVLGITFTLITVRVGLGWSHGTRPLSNGKTADGTIHFVNPTGVADSESSEMGMASCSTTSIRA